MSEEFERSIGPDRRAFIKRMVIGVAFAAPIVSSFTMGGVKGAFGGTLVGDNGTEQPNTTTTTAPETLDVKAVSAQPRSTG